MQTPDNKINNPKEFMLGEIAHARKMADREFVKKQRAQPSFEKQITEHDRQITEETERIRKELEAEDIDTMSSETQRAYLLKYIGDIKAELASLDKRKKTLKFLLSPRERRSVRKEEEDAKKDLDIAQSNFNFLAIKNVGPINPESGELVPDIFVASTIKRLESLKELKKNKKKILDIGKSPVLNIFRSSKSKNEKERINMIRLSIIDEEIEKAQNMLEDYVSGDKKVDITSELAMDQFVLEEQKRQRKVATGVSEFQAGIEKEILDKTMDIFSAVEYKTEEGKDVSVYPKDFGFKIKESKYEYKISKGQTIILNDKEYSFVGLSKNGNLVFYDSNLVREVSKQDFEKSLERKNLVTYEMALAIVGYDNILGPEDITKAFGVSIENIKPIPFNEKEIELHKALGHKLVYEINRTPEGLPLTLAELSQRAGSNVIKAGEYRLYKERFDDKGNIKKDAWFAKEAGMLSETPEEGWKFVSIDVIPGTESKNYIDQTDFLIKYFKDNIFKPAPAGASGKSGLPEEYKKAFGAWGKDKAKIQQLITDAKWPEAAKALGEHPVSELLRENFTSTIYRTIALQKSRNQKILPSMYSWSRSFSSGGDLVCVGVFDAGGARVNGGRSGNAWTDMGAVFSRMKPLEIEL